MKPFLFCLTAITFLTFLIPFEAMSTDDKKKDDRAERRDQRTAVFNLDEGTTDEQIGLIRSVLSITEGVARVHVCSSNSTVVVEYSADSDQCTRRLISVFREIGVTASLRERNVESDQERNLLRALSPHSGRGERSIRTTAASRGY